MNEKQFIHCAQHSVISKYSQKKNIIHKKTLKQNLIILEMKGIVHFYSFLSCNSRSPFKMNQFRTDSHESLQIPNGPKASPHVSHTSHDCVSGPWPRQPSPPQCPHRTAQSWGVLVRACAPATLLAQAPHAIFFPFFTIFFSFFPFFLITFFNIFSTHFFECFELKVFKSWLKNFQILT